MIPERALIERQLDTIFASEDFVSAPKMRSLLRYLVDATLAGDAERLKGYTIGVDVFERSAEFDPGTDPIVRVQAGRLRKLLETYYRTSGRDDPVRIEIPRGGYTVSLLTGHAQPEADQAGTGNETDPVEAVLEMSRPWARAGHFPLLLLAAGSVLALLLFFGIRSFDRAGAPAEIGTQAADPAPVSDAITLAILPFTDMSRDTSNASFADGLTDALTTALARAKSISLASRTSAFQYREATDLRRVGRELGVRFIVEGAMQRHGEQIRINVQLIDAETDAHIWAQEFNRVLGNEFAVQSELVTTLAAELRPQLYNAFKRTMRGRPARPETAWQLYMRSTWVPGEARNSLAWEKERVAFATRAVNLDPNLGQAHSVLADKLAYLATVDPPSDTDEARTSAQLHARRALDLAASDADVLFNLSIHYWHSGRIAESLEATRRTLELDPNHVLARFLVMAVPYTCSEAPQGVIDSLLAFDANLSPDNPVRWLTWHWISLLYLNTGDFTRALEASRRSDQVFRTPNTTYLLAALLVQNGETQEAIEKIANQGENWPNLDARHYADVTIRRRCKDAPRAEFIHRIFSALADAIDANRRGG